MQSSPLMWDRVHSYHNPLTGSYHSPPSSAFLGFEDAEPPLHESSPPGLFPTVRVSSGSIDKKAPWSQAREKGFKGFDPMQYFCAMCCPSVLNDHDKELKVG